MNFNSLSFLTAILFVCLVCLPTDAASPVLTDIIKKDLTTAQSILGKKVTKDTFTKKPLLINFFASW